MNQPYLSTRTLTAAVSAVGVLCFGAESLSADSPAAWAPKDSIIYVGITNCDAMVASAKKTAGWRMMEDPAARKLTDRWKKVTKKIQQFIADKLGLESPKELEVYPHGPAALFLTLAPPANEDEAPQPSVGLIMDMGEDIDRMKVLVRKALRKAYDRGARKSVKEIAGTEVMTIRFKRKSDREEMETQGGPDPELMALAQEIAEALELDPMEAMALNQTLSNLGVKLPKEFAFAYSGSRFVLASDTRTAEQAVKRLKGGTESSFAADAAMRSLSRHCAPNADVQFVVNIPGVVELASASNADAPKSIKALGLRSLGALVSTFEVAPSSGIDFRGRGFLQVRGEPVGVAKLLMMPNRRTAPPASISADTAVFGSANINPSAILAEVIEIATRMNAAWGEQMRAAMKRPQLDGSMLDIQKDVVDYLTGPLFGGLTLSSPYDNDHVGAMLALGHRSRQAVDKLLAMIPPGVLMASEMMGSTIFDAALPVSGVALAVTDKVLIVPGTRPTIESYIRGENRDGGGLADDPEFKRALRHVPRESSVMFFGSGRKLFDAQMAIHKAGDLTDSPQLFMSSAGAFLRYALLQNFIGAELEDARPLRKYQTSAILTVSRQSDGLRFDGVYLTGNGG